MSHSLPLIVTSPTPFSFFFTHPPPPEIYTLPYTTLFRSPVHRGPFMRSAFLLVSFIAASTLAAAPRVAHAQRIEGRRSEEHTSELQSRGHLVCRLLLEKKKKNKTRK